MSFIFFYFINFKSGWWFRDCLTVNLNGPFESGMQWLIPSTGEWTRIRKSRMALKRKLDKDSHPESSVMDLTKADSYSSNQVDLQELLQNTNYDIRKKYLRLPGRFSQKKASLLLDSWWPSSFLRVSIFGFGRFRRSNHSTEQHKRLSQIRAANWHQAFPVTTCKIQSAATAAAAAAAAAAAKSISALAKALRTGRKAAPFSLASGVRNVLFVTNSCS